MEIVETKPYDDQAPGTSGLRKTVKRFTEKNYLQNFVQAIFNSLPPAELAGSTIVISGDGRFFTKEAGQIIIKMAAANGVAKVVVGTNFWMSTPAVSAVIRDLKAYGGIIMTASHNPGGPDADFGVKYNISNGGAAPEKITDSIFANTKILSSFKIARFPDVDVSKVSSIRVSPKFEVEVIDGASTHIALLKSIFDFPSLKDFVSRPDFKLVFDAMHGIAGPTAYAIFVEEFGLPESTVLNCVPLEDFGGGHPDPNLTYAEELVKIMGLHPDTANVIDVPQFGAAADGDADRNMVLGSKFFVTPSDSLAIIAANASSAIPFFKTNGVSGVARSMPTSTAVDRVANKLGISLYEVPTGWKFFGNLLDANKISLCGEESFGTGSNHIREKDGIWAVLAWLSILAFKNQQAKKFVSVEDIVKEHWKTFGRNYYVRYDYESVDKESAIRMFDRLRVLQKDVSKIEIDIPGYKLALADDFSYRDPIDNSLSANQGLRFLFEDGSRIVFRLSGTGSVGATIRIYIEQYEADPSKVDKDAKVALKPLIDLSLKLSQIREFTGREGPTVIT